MRYADSNTIIVRIAELATLVREILVSAGMSEENAQIVGEVVVAAERDGSRSHGIFRVPSMVEILRSGWVDGFATPAVVDKSTGLVLADGGNGFAQIAYAAARGLLIEKARLQGIAMFAIRNAHHFCALWPDVEPLAERGLVAIAFVNSRSYVVPAGGRTRHYGTNPMAFACPRRAGPPMAWDQASSAMAHGEVLLARRDGRPLPRGVGLDCNGRPTTDPTAVLEGGALLPFGGYKGSSIALMVELLAAAVTGGYFGFQDDGNPNSATKNAGELVIAIDPEQSAGAPFLDRVEEVFSRIVKNGKARLPGDRRYAERRRAVSTGIMLERSFYEELVALSH
jgi:delta1-piperideine-2-carboxylate reductase